MLSQPCSILHNPGSDNARLEFEYEMFTCKLEADNRRLQARQCSGTAKECMRDMSEVTYNAFLEVQAWLHAQCQRYEVELLRDNSEKTMRKLAGNQASLLNSSVELKDALAEAQVCTVLPRTDTAGSVTHFRQPCKSALGGFMGGV